MFVDARKLTSGTSVEADICVVGAGAAGISLAREFARSPVRLCLLESGGLEFDAQTQSLYEGEVRGRAYYDLSTTRLRYFGGATNHWGGWSRPLDEIDFEERPYVPHSGWPITQSDLKPYYTRAYGICGLRAFSFEPEHFAEALPALYRTPLGDEDGGVRRIWQRSFPQVRFGQDYRDVIAQARNVHCYLYANLSAIETNDSATWVKALRVACLNGKRFRVGAKVFILACGGIENARLLLAPNAAHPAGIGNDFDQVGRYFMLHPWLPAGQILAVGSAVRLHEPGSEEYGKSVRVGISVSATRQRSEGLPNHAVLWSLSAKTHRPRRIVDPGRSLLSDLRDILDDLQEVVGDFYDKLRGARSDETVLDVALRMEHAPNPDSRVSLSSKKNALGLNQAAVDWRFRAGEKAAVRRTVKLIGEVIGSLGAGRLRIADWLAADDDRWPKQLEPDHHHMGTTRMSTSPRTGVVNSDCRVHGVSNLYVAGSSVFPTGGFCNPTLTIVALVLRLADHIKRVIT